MEKSILYRQFIRPVLFMIGGVIAFPFLLIIISAIINTPFFPSEASEDFNLPWLYRVALNIEVGLIMLLDALYFLFMLFIQTPATIIIHLIYRDIRNMASVLLLFSAYIIFYGCYERDWLLRFPFPSFVFALLFASAAAFFNFGGNLLYDQPLALMYCKADESVMRMYKISDHHPERVVRQMVCVHKETRLKRPITDQAVWITRIAEYLFLAYFFMFLRFIVRKAKAELPPQDTQPEAA